MFPHMNEPCQSLHQVVKADILNRPEVHGAAVCVVQCGMRWSVGLCGLVFLTPPWRFSGGRWHGGRIWRASSRQGCAVTALASPPIQPSSRASQHRLTSQSCARCVLHAHLVGNVHDGLTRGVSQRLSTSRTGLVPSVLCPLPCGCSVLSFECVLSCPMRRALW